MSGIDRIEQRVQEIETGGPPGGQSLSAGAWRALESRGWLQGKQCTRSGRLPTFDIFAVFVHLVNLAILNRLIEKDTEMESRESPGSKKEANRQKAVGN